MTALPRLLTGMAHVPEGLWRPVARAGGRAASLAPNQAVRQWQANAAVVLGRQPTRAETARAMDSWARNLVLSSQLGRWPAERLLAQVEVQAEDRERLVDLHNHGGVVVALPHMGSWDLAGAWACALGLAVSTVAERVPDFDWYVATRERLGFTVHAHDDPKVMAKLIGDARAGRMVCLVSDRAFSIGGAAVRWRCADGTHTVRLPMGPAMLARRTGATLLGCAAHFTRDGMRLAFSEPITPHGAATTVMTQDLADFFSDHVLQDVTDWHMLVPFFTDQATDWA